MLFFLIVLNVTNWGSVTFSKQEVGFHNAKWWKSTAVDVEGECSVQIPNIFQNTNADSDDDEWPALGAPDPPRSKRHQSFSEDVTFDEKDEEALNAFMNPNPPARKTLADVIMGKIAGLLSLSFANFV